MTSTGGNWSSIVVAPGLGGAFLRLARAWLRYHGDHFKASLQMCAARWTSSLFLLSLRMAIRSLLSLACFTPPAGAFPSADGFFVTFPSLAFVGLPLAAFGVLGSATGLEALRGVVASFLVPPDFDLRGVAGIEVEARGATSVAVADGPRTPRRGVTGRCRGVGSSVLWLVSQGSCAAVTGAGAVPR